MTEPQGQPKVVHDAQGVDRLIAVLVDSILERESSLENTALVGVRRRGVPLAERIREGIKSRTGNDLPLGVLDITLYRDDLSLISPQPLVRGTDIEFNISGMRTLLVDDVLYTGRTVRAALDALSDFGRPRRIELAVLIDRGHRELPIQADHVGGRVETEAREMVEVRLRGIDEEDQVLLLRR
ncbi:MAG: bifunctional pyr operon transcriptional regulator/uracil phosphoribosyltransferase PyrR [Planctomycetota bacterium]|nr:bifunctional pyr operon transcriptional regulator/uracil phosphoribosyltransferase PyrR [Planctomycetota bacterium]